MLALAIQMEGSEAEGGLSVARNICFSYAFAVENEVKLRLGKRVSKLLTQSDTKKLLHAIYDERIDNLDIFFNQYLIRIHSGQAWENWLSTTRRRRLSTLL